MAAPGSTIAITDLDSTTASQVLDADSSRSLIRFHNPNASVSVLVWEENDADGTALAPTFAAPGGGFLVYAGAFLEIEGAAGSAWKALAESGSSDKSLTIWVGRG